MTFNPFDMQKQLFDEWEKNLAQSIDKLMRQPEFMKVVARSLGTTMDVQGAIKKQLNAALKSLALPNEADMTRLYKTINDLETRVLDLEERLEDMAEAQDAEARKAAAAPKVKTPPAAAAPKKAAPKKAAPKKTAPKKASK